MMLIKKIILVVFASISLLKAEEKNCPELDKNISAHLITDDFYNYEDFLHYSLGKFSSVNKKKYNFNKSKDLNLVAINSDIIFGEFNDLKRINFNKEKLDIPNYIQKYYTKNRIKNLGKNNNLFPLDLDTFILISKEEIEKIKYEEDFYNFIDPNKYTLSQSFYSENETLNFFKYLLKDNVINFKKPFFESILFNQNNRYSLVNKNTFFSTYDEVVSSFYNNENLFGVFTDGFAYREKINFISYPNSNLIWNDKLGKFIINENKNYSSFFGFSALVNNKKGFIFLCYLTKKELRETLITKFNIGISPLSINDILDPSSLTDEYINILDLKNKNIKNNEFLEESVNQKYSYESILRFIINKDISIFANEKDTFFKN